jgi:hypothetical protein
MARHVLHGEAELTWVLRRNEAWNEGSNCLCQRITDFETLTIYANPARNAIIFAHIWILNNSQLRYLPIP